MSDDDLPLRTLRVADLGDPVCEAAAHLLADLGADVIKVEPPGGAPTRRQRPLARGYSVPFATRNANKRGMVADLTTRAGVERVTRLLGDADIVFVSLAEARLLDVDALARQLPRLVIVVLSPFGRTGPRADWQATQRTLLALSGSLARSGRPGDPPLLPPDGLAEATAAAHAAWTALGAHALARRSGTGQVVDLSQHEAVVTGLDPAFGVQGSAAAGKSGAIRRGRPPADAYPVFRCADGFVRLCLLSKRQWRGMFAWLGSPADFADPAYDSIAGRARAAAQLNPLIAALFAQRAGEDLVAEAATRGVPLARVLSLSQVLAADHFTVAGTIDRARLAPRLDARIPVGCVRVNGRRLGIRMPAPEVATDGRGQWQPTARLSSQSPVPGRPSLPFAGIRVLDLGVIVFGAEASRAFADLGADVIKIESRSYPDGLRQTRRGEEMNASFAWGHRNKRSLGLDLRSPEGRAVFLDLVRRSDVVLSNFKPGTLESLGIGFETLTSRNPGIVVLESGAYSAAGPWARRLGYGPLVRASCGISSLWRYTADDDECWDGVTVFPDHVAGKVGAIAVASALLARELDGRGRHIELAQSDLVLYLLAAYVAQESIRPGSVGPAGNRGGELFGGVFACAGDDQWCVIDARTEDELAELAAAVRAGEGTAPGRELTAAIAKWTATRTPADVMELLQARGVPAGAMLRSPELPVDPQLRHRGTFTTLRHPAIGDNLPAESAAAPYARLPASQQRPAPMTGEHTREICHELLGMDHGQIDDLASRGVLQELPASTNLPR